MGRQVLWQRPGDPYGPYCGQCCDNCVHYWFDGQTHACDLNDTLWDDRFWQDPEYADDLNDKCPDWVSRFIKSNQKQETLI